MFEAMIELIKLEKLGAESKVNLRSTKVLSASSIQSSTRNYCVSFIAFPWELLRIALWSLHITLFRESYAHNPLKQLLRSMYICEWW